MVIATESLLCDPNFLLEDSYNHETFKVVDFSFVFHTVDDCRKLLRNA